METWVNSSNILQQGLRFILEIRAVEKVLSWFNSYIFRSYRLGLVNPENNDKIHVHANGLSQRAAW